MTKREKKYQYFSKLYRLSKKERYLFGLREFGIIILLIIFQVIGGVLTIALIIDSHSKYAVTSFSFGAPVILLVIQVLLLELNITCYINCHSDKYIKKQIELFKSESKDF